MQTLGLLFKVFLTCTETHSHLNGADCRNLATATVKMLFEFWKKYPETEMTHP